MAELRYTPLLPPRRCGCKPGSYASGWMEERSAECDRWEREVFVRAITSTKINPGDARYGKVENR